MNESKWVYHISSVGEEPPVERQHRSMEREGGWLPSVESLADYISDLKSDLEKERGLKFAPEVEELRDLVEGDLRLRMLAAQMLTEVPVKFAHNPDLAPEVENFNEILRMINLVIRRPPPFGMSLPLNSVLEWWMGTKAGFVFFLDEKVNKALSKILQAWCAFLDSSDSLSALEGNTDTSWVSDKAKATLHIEDFECDSEKPHWGFKSFNDFFIRKFKAGVRPIDSPEDSSLIVSACESLPYNIQTNVKEHDHFWIKKQPYSLHEMLAGKFVNEFVDGVVYQAFLSANNYHRWHCPVDGTIKDAFVQPGTYYAEAPSMGFDPDGPTLSQGYISHLAARAVIFVEAEAPIGLVATIFVGMGEVSSNLISVSKGQKVKKGEELGYFQFGGSTYCMVFRKGVIESFVTEAIPSPHAKIVKLGKRIAHVSQGKQETE